MILSLFYLSISWILVEAAEKASLNENIFEICDTQSYWIFFLE